MNMTTVPLWIIAVNMSVWTFGFVLIVWKEAIDGKIYKTKKWTG